MKDSLQIFKQGLSDLQHHIEGLELESQLISFVTDKKSDSKCEYLVSAYQKHISEARLERRRFNYNSIIVSLYGFLEQFVESLIESYLRKLNMIIPDYADIPDEITKNYISISIDFMTNRSATAKYEGLVTKEQLISDMHSCIKPSSEYRINPYPFVHHTANFRFDVIASSFDRIGVRNVSGRAIKSPVFRKYLKEKDPGSVDRTTPKEALSDLDDLVSRRNEVAHGELPDDIFDNQMILGNYIPLLEAYGRALYDVVYSEILRYEVKHRGTELGPPIKVFRQGKVLGISLTNTHVKVGDLLVARTGNKHIPYVAGNILELQVNNERCEEISASSLKTDIGICVPFRAKENQTFFLIRKKINAS